MFAGLAMDPDMLDLILGRHGGGYIPPDPTAKMHESLTAMWWPAEFIPKRLYDWKRDKMVRRLHLGRRRAIPPGSLIHQSAYERGSDYRSQLPPNAIVAPRQLSTSFS